MDGARWTPAAQGVGDPGAQTLIRREGDDGWRQPQSTSYESEGALQAPLAESPAPLPGVDDGTVVVREFPVSVGSIDLVGLDGDGEIVICEYDLVAWTPVRR